VWGLLVLAPDQVLLLVEQQVLLELVELGQGQGQGQACQAVSLHTAATAAARAADPLPVGPAAPSLLEEQE
jgi:hypothetical protein